MVVPVVMGVANSNPDLEITVVSRAFCAPLFERAPQNLKFIGADFKGVHKGFKGLNRLYRELSSLHFDAVADLHDVLRSKYLRLRFILGGTPCKSVNKGRRDRKRFITPGIYHGQPLRPMFERYGEVFSKLGLKLSSDFTSIYGSEGSRGELDRVAELLGVEEISKRSEGERWLGIAPFAAHPGKQFPLERWGETIRRIIEGSSTLSEVDGRETSHSNSSGSILNSGEAATSNGATGKPLIFLFGAKGAEESFLNDLARELTNRGFKNILTVAGKLRLGDELALMSNLDLMISMDSANMHLASLVNTPVLSIWGATSPNGGFLGWHQSLDNVVESDLPCRPCSIYGEKRCNLGGSYLCISMLEDMVVEKALRCLKA